MDLDNQLKLERHEQLLRGFNPQNSLQFEIPCIPCKGRGWFGLDMMAEATIDCKYCRGTGYEKDAFTK